MQTKPQREISSAFIEIITIFLFIYTIIFSVTVLNKLDSLRLTRDELARLLPREEYTDKSGGESTAGRETEISLPNAPAGSFGEGEPMYLMREYDGMIGLFSYATGELCGIFEVYVNTLPASDREILAGGIEIRTNSELLSRIEDYTG